MTNFKYWVTNHYKAGRIRLLPLFSDGQTAEYRLPAKKKTDCLF
ncbi:hypothetical protein NEIELOOT_01698 [Neisseria elongata subsp. glycolytica ATCC 29315]|uniref:Uncharacterized protein n=1 Tax=Neisseria elongata subsp. glycolytica ATCC 29315 TaxID=546263 RepID=D4DRK5_NEIEG|nr:hypothetical protein NEIELOOT_01698 [Neisseria elongata subsp. glycolytica ATCC 29315]